MISSVINALWIDSRNPNVLLAASEYDGLFRSSDGGSHWGNVYRTTAATVFAQLGDTVYAATAAGILASSDDGASWSVSLAGDSSVARRRSPRLRARAEARSTPG